MVEERGVQAHTEGLGARLVREFAADISPRPAPASAVPTAGRGKKPPEPEPDTGGMEPQPTT